MDIKPSPQSTVRPPEGRVKRLRDKITNSAVYLYFVIKPYNVVKTFLGYSSLFSRKSPRILKLVDRQLGKGGNGTVSEIGLTESSHQSGEKGVTGDGFARKLPNSKHGRAVLDQEAKMMWRLDHPNIIKAQPVLPSENAVGVSDYLTSEFDSKSTGATDSEQTVVVQDVDQEQAFGLVMEMADSSLADQFWKVWARAAK